MEDASQENGVQNSGARKVALFLSILEPKTAELLLSLFDPEVARTIANEAGTIAPASPEDVEKIISEFLETVGSDALGTELTDALVAQARSNVRPLDLTEKTAVSEENRAALSTLEGIESTRIADTLCGERTTTIAAVASLLSSRRRAELMEQIPANQQKLVSRITTRPGVTDALRRLEDVLFERTLDDER